MRKVLLFNLCILVLVIFISVDVTANDVTSLKSTNDIITEIKNEKKVIDNKNKDALNSITVDNNDGTNTVYIFEQDIKYYDDEGNVIDKDLSLKKSSDIHRIKDGYILTVKSNDIESSFPFTLKDKGIIMENLELRPKGTDATLNDERFDLAEYKNVFNGVDISFKPEYQGVSAKIEADAIGSLNNIKFQILDDSIQDIYSEDGKIIVEDKYNIYEITGTTITNANNEEIGVITLSLDANDDIAVEYELFENVSDSENVSSNISVTIQNNRILSLTIFEDTVPNPDGYNYIGSKIGYGVARTLIKFDLSALEGVSYDKIISAFYSTHVVNGEDSGLADVYMVTSAWDETLEYIDFMPNVDFSNIIFSIGMRYNYEFIDLKEFYITSAVQAWLQGYENNGIMIKTRNDEGWAKFNAASNNTAGTCLVVKYSNDSDVPISKGIEKGEVYYFINKKTKSSINVLNEAPPSTLVLNNFAMSDLEGWHVIYDSTIDGVEYFKLRHFISASFLEASEPDSQGNSYVSTQTSNNIDGQKWRIVRNWNGSYKIIPKNSDGSKALCVQTTLTGKKNLALDTITIDSNESDDWTILPYYKGNATLYGSCLKCSDIDSQTEIANVTTSLTGNGYNCINYHCCNLTSNSDSGENTEEMAYKYLKKMFDSQIWYFSHHGINSRMQFKEPNSSESESQIGVKDTIIIDEEYHMNINVYGVSDYEGDLNKLQFAFINSCLTGANNKNENLIGTMYEEGAHFVMSHTASVYTGFCHEWQKWFNIAFQVTDVKNAISFADRASLYYVNISNWYPKHFLGDTSIFYNYEANAIGLADNASIYSAKNDNENIANLNELYLLPNAIADTSVLDKNEMYYEYDNNGNIYGYSKPLRDNFEYDVQLLYSYNDRYNELGNNYIDSYTSAITLASNFITQEMNFRITSDYDISYTTNTYTNEFVFKCMDSDASSNEIMSMVVYIEEDDNNNQHVTFFQARYGN